MRDCDLYEEKVCSKGEGYCADTIDGCPYMSDRTCNNCVCFNNGYPNNEACCGCFEDKGHVNWRQVKEEYSIIDKPYAMKMAAKYYSKEGYEHAIRVAGYIRENCVMPLKIKGYCETLAIMHDLLEDTNYTLVGVKDAYFCKCLTLLTRSKDVSYVDYIKQIRENAVIYPEIYWVKLADMKDHLMLKETLTYKLKEKYLQALPYLL